MSFTVEKSLQLAAFQKCRLLTGPAGLANEIRSVNILEILDDLRHIEAGEFLITTAYGFDFEDLTNQQRLMELFAGNRLAALAIQTGHYIKAVPLGFIGLARSYQIPVIEIPAEASFKNMTRALLEEVVQQDHARQNGELLLHQGKLETLARQSRALLDKLLGGVNPELLRASLKEQHLSLHAGIYLLAISTRAREEKRQAGPAQLETAADRQLERTLLQLLLQYNIPFLTGTHELNQVVLVQPLDPGQERFKLQARRLLHELKLLYPGLVFTMGISSRGRVGLHTVRTALDEALKALEGAELRLLGDDGLLSYEELGAYRLLLEIKNRVVLEAVCKETVEPLLEYDHRSRGDLVQTVRVYLKHRNISTAAEALFVHRHTLRYRLNQIEELTGFKLNDPVSSFQFQLGLMVFDYLQALEKD